MPPVEGARWALVVFGMPALLLGVVGVAYAGAYVVPGAPCTGSGDLAPPETDVTVAANDSTVVAVHSGGDDLGGATTDRVVVAVEDAESELSYTTEWVGASGSLREGGSLTVHERDLGFGASDRDVVTVRWYGNDPEVAGFCPNGRTLSDLRTVRIGNASAPVYG